MSTTGESLGFVPLERLTRTRDGRRALELRPARLDVAALEARLRQSVHGEVRFDEASRALYAQDASNYRRIPLGVVVPSSVHDVVATLAACRAEGAPVVSRGGGTALAGQTVNEAVVLDFSKRMNRILAIDPRARTARVELGVVCDDLSDALREFHLTFGPQPATHDRCCFGGMLANNCGGMRAQRNGTAVYNVEAMDVVLYDGTRMRLGWMNEDELRAKIERGGAEGAILADLRALRDRYADRIRAGYPRLPRRVSGYNLDQLLPGTDGRFNLARLVVGSEGTLVTMLDATVTLLHAPAHTAVVVLGFRDVFAAADAVPDFLDLQPQALEGIDDILKSHIQKRGGAHARHMDLLPEGGGWLAMELAADDEGELHRRVEDAFRRVPHAVVDRRVYFDAVRQKQLWAVREGALGSTAFVPGEPDSWPGWEDSAVPTEQLGAYLRDLRALYDRYDYHPALYGHFGMGLVHCRVPFGLEDAAEVAKFRRFMGDAADLVVSYGGSLSGEHGDGQARAELLVKMFGPDLMQAMRELKAIFDPANKMNPGKIVDPYPIVDHLRLWPNYRPPPLETHFRYADDHGSFARATLRCVGVGKCRRKDGEGEHDVMCPSYMVTHEEKHSTRGRAHLLWEMARGDGPIRDGWKSEGVKEALDLCLACKGCKSDCPVGVDVATYKAEFLAHYYEGRARPRHAYAFGFIDKWARLAELAPGLANLFTQLPATSAIAKRAAGIDARADVPPFASKTFRAQFAERGARVRSARKVVLWPDTFNDHFHPDTAMAAVDVLEAAGYEVLVPRERACCGRPLYDFGFLDEARVYLRRTIAALAPYVDAELPIVVLEPSCASVFKDELVNLLGTGEARALAARVTTLPGLLARDDRWKSLPRFEGGARAIVQGHCHEKAMFGMDDERALLERMGVEVEVLSAGCCGMAGAFGFVEDTRDVGHACGERALLPRVRREATSTFVVADGFSCREQIRQHTRRSGLHVAEVIKMALDGARAGSPARVLPERSIVARRKHDAERSAARAGLTLAAIAALGAVGVTAWWTARRRRRASEPGEEPWMNEEEIRARSAHELG